MFFFENPYRVGLFLFKIIFLQKDGCFGCFLFEKPYRGLIMFGGV
jgi:hypothetical protein